MINLHVAVFVRERWALDLARILVKQILGVAISVTLLYLESVGSLKS